jgi:phospholipid/cholesterol/gamma-HCH transport system permease protein
VNPAASGTGAIALAGPGRTAPPGAARPALPGRPFPRRSPPLAALDALRYVFRLAETIYLALGSIWWEGRRGTGLITRITLQQVYFTAVQALPLTLFIAIAFGGLLMAQASIHLPRFGLHQFEELMGLLIFRELAPICVALIVIARSANAIVVEIGNMRVNGELRALELLAINLDRFIVLPRLIGMVLSVTLLIVAFCVAAYFGGFWLARLSGLLESNFVQERLARGIPFGAVRNILLRGLVFGLIIGSAACLHGLRVQVSPTEVPQQATRGVISALSLCFVANFILSLGR